VRRDQSDHFLDENIVRGLVDAQFPGLSGQPVSRFGAGWDHELFSVGEQWILRFPRRAERVPWLLREQAILAAVVPVLGPLVPAFELAGQPSAAYDYPFVGYRRLPGVGADQVPVAAGLASDLGRVLAALHRVRVGQIPPTPNNWGKEPLSGLRDELASVAHLARPVLEASVLDAALLARAEPYLSGLVTLPAQDGPVRFIHDDICPDHLLVDPVTGRLTGLIDFTDALVGDPVLDFTGLIGVGGYDFIAQVVDAYDLPLGDSFWDRLSWRVRTLTLTWLTQAITDDPAAIPMHLNWVTRALAPTPTPAPTPAVPVL
jgi:aminoglycoside phosphotransferase (APT) family kinase protein